MVTILDVANAANVSTATVSRVLNGSYSVTEEKRQRVLDAIAQVGYQIPNRIRQTQQTPESVEAPTGGKTFLLVICSEFIFPIIHAFQKTAAQLGYCVVIAHYDSLDEFTHISGLIASLSPFLAGIALINCHDSSRAFQDLVGSYPMVQIGEPIMEDVPNHVVYNDEIKMAEDATNYLLNLDRRKIGILTADPNSRAPLFLRKKRLNGYYLALMNHDLPIDQSLVEFVDVSIDGGYEGALKLLTRHPDLDAILGITDVIAQGAVYAVRTVSKEAKQPIVFSMDNNEVWDFTHTSFPYIDPHHEEIGDSAAHVLHAVIENRPEYDHRIVIRHTLQCSQHPLHQTSDKRI